MKSAIQHYADTPFKAGLDPCQQIFAASWPKYWDFPQNARVLEIGCAEADWIGPMKQARPDLTITGIDWRPCVRPAADRVIQGDVLTAKFEPESFDAIVLISALEHIGLGHYDSDPKQQMGDTRTLRHAEGWLKPRGLLYFDVPWTPGEHYDYGTKCRVYSDESIYGRLMYGNNFDWVVDAYVSPPDHNAIVPRPEKPGTPWHYRACVWRKR